MQASGSSPCHGAAVCVCVLVSRVFLHCRACLFRHAHISMSEMHLILEVVS
jgi:hypothetical protein